jgi:hypothetical protein
MTGNKVPAGDSKWEVVLLFLDVHDAAFSPVMTLSDAMLLLERFTLEFPDEAFKPKMHFLTHYGSHCRAFGPMINYWSFRFESKQGYFKEAASRIKCRRNVL